MRGSDLTSGAIAPRHGPRRAPGPDRPRLSPQLPGRGGEPRPTTRPDLRRLLGAEGGPQPPPPASAGVGADGPPPDARGVRSAALPGRTTRRSGRCVVVVRVRRLQGDPQDMVAVARWPAYARRGSRRHGGARHIMPQYLTCSARPLARRRTRVILCIGCARSEVDITQASGA